mgnify:FL=1
MADMTEHEARAREVLAEIVECRLYEPCEIVILLNMLVALALLIAAVAGCTGWTCGPNPEQPGVRCVRP